MPALYLFGKRTLLAGDDLQLPAALTIGARIVQVVCLALPISIWLINDAGKSGESLFFFLITDPSHDASCTHSHYYPLFNSLHLLGTLLFGIVSVFLELQIWHWTSQGTPTIREPRSSKVQLLLERKFSYLTMSLIGVVFLYITGIGFAQTYLVCHEEEDDANTLWIGTHSWWILSAVLIFSQVAELLLISLFLARLILQHDGNGDGVWNNTNAHHYHRNLSQELWTDRCHWMCKCLSISTCCLFGGQDLIENHNPAVSTNNIYQQVAIALAEYLETRGTLDVVPSDLITGLLMLQKIQEQRKLKAQIQVRRSSHHQQQQQQRHTSIVVDESPGIQMEPQNTSKKSLTRRIRTGNTPEPKSRSSSFSQRAASSGSLSASGSSSSSLTGLVETSHLVPPTLPEDPRVLGRTDVLYAPRNGQVLDPNNPTDQDFLQEGAQMAKYALAIYTWMLYVFVNPISGFPNILCRSCKLCCCTSKQSYRNRGSRNSNGPSLLGNDEEFPTTIGDNLCQWHKSALLLVAQLDHTDLVYAQLENRLSLMPYCILLDHETKCIVISIRGSLSLEDLVTDALIDPESCEGLGEEFGFDAHGQYCHAGVVACVNNIYQDLQRHRLLDSLAEDFPDYGLRLVGHSLGAASATLLGYMLKSRYNDLKVYNFSPPSTMTWDMATQCSEWTTSFVLDADIVPRLSVLSMEDLRDEVLQLIGNLKVPKHQVFESIFANCTTGQCFGGPDSEPEEMDLEQNLIDMNRKISEMLIDDEPIDTVYHRQLQEFLRIQAELKRSRGDSRTQFLYPPGRMIHLLKTGEDSGCSHAMKKCMTCCMSNSGFRYTPIYISNDDLNRIVVGPTMGTDHFVDRMYFELSNVASQFERRYQDESSGR